MGLASFSSLDEGAGARRLRGGRIGGGGADGFCGEFAGAAPFETGKLYSARYP